MFLADAIQKHWHDLGARNVRVWAERMGSLSLGRKVKEQDTLWQVRSNLVSGLQPVEGQETSACGEAPQ